MNFVNEVNFVRFVAKFVGFRDSIANNPSFATIARLVGKLSSAGSMNLPANNQKNQFPPIFRCLLRTREQERTMETLATRKPCNNGNTVYDGDLVIKETCSRDKGLCCVTSKFIVIDGQAWPAKMKYYPRGVLRAEGRQRLWPTVRSLFSLTFSKVTNDEEKTPKDRGCAGPLGWILEPDPRVLLAAPCDKVDLASRSFISVPATHTERIAKNKDNASLHGQVDANLADGVDKQAGNFGDLIKRKVIAEELKSYENLENHSVEKFWKLCEIIALKISENLRNCSVVKVLEI
ncbi:hypothetical protein WH47_09736 [Habropoda laboriosa]|uniref:Uncharacterized protein n=1 Tax=Habropoda laboriosa TaxID=597456 RepID=A0A0L7QMD9_9HYME|nr:hypothetical protein WH47_09736 [Habropoda laboriosa]